jgi:hypothetical protein
MIGYTHTDIMNATTMALTPGLAFFPVGVQQCLQNLPLLGSPRLATGARCTFERL